MTELAWVTLSTPVGPLSAGCSEAGVSQVRFGGPLRPGSPPGAAPGPARDLSGVVLAQLTEYFSGQRRLASDAFPKRGETACRVARPTR